SGTYEFNLEVIISSTIANEVSDGAYVRQVIGSEDGWEYDETEYFITYSSDGIYYWENNESYLLKSYLAFTNTYTKNTYTLTFDTSGGSTIDPVPAAAGDVIDLRGFPLTREHYTFEGWYTDDTLQTQVTSVTLNANTTVYAEWTALYTLSFDTNGGSDIADVTGEEGEVIDLSVYEPTREDYIFDGWYSDSTLETEVTSVTLGEDTKVYAGWTALYTLSFETNGGSAIADVTGEEGEVIDLSDYEPTREDYIFDGWYSDSTLETEVTSVTLGEDTKVYAGWTALYTLSFETNGGSAIADVTDEEGTVIDLSGYTPTRDDYTFAGWYSDSGLTSHVTSVTLNADTIVYAKWNDDGLYEIDGTVSDNNGLLVDIEVSLWCGITKISTTKTDENGHYSFKHVAAGTYNIVATRPVDEAGETYQTVTALDTITNHSDTVPINMPTTNINSILSITPSSNDSAVNSAIVGGLNDEAIALANGNKTTTYIVTMAISAQADDPTDTEQQAIQEIKVNDNQTMEFIEMTVKKTIDITTTDVHQTTNVLEIILSGFAGKDVTVYRYHDVAEVLNYETTKADCTYYLDDNGAVHIFADKYSLYAIGYTDSTGTTPTSSGGSSSRTYTITVDESEGGSVSPSGTVRVTRGGSQTFTITPDDGYKISDVLVDGESVGAVSSYTFSNVSTNHTISVTYTEAGGSGVPDWLNTVNHVKYFVGYETGLFGPDNAMTRAEAAMMFYRLLTDTDVTLGKTFTDVADDAWYAEAVRTLAALGIIEGYPDGTFAPNEPITRAELMAIATRFAVSDTTVQNTFPDVSEDDWFCECVLTAISYGWVIGYPDGTLRPENVITRAEVATVVNRMLERVADRDFMANHAEELTTFPDVTADHWAHYEIAEAINGHDYTKSDDEDEVWTELK
ncbi:MAG: InlB B-repeat-containing protein, partial [Oscillospiraceae bacterium]|nr:InlB B-repeat-containing protein [Oscillospiraceae bacterium]